MSDTFDLVVIGGGPGGYAAALRAAQLGLKVACVEERAALGGTCLNVGCIPSKALLHASHLYAQARNGLADWGVRTGKVSLDLAAMMGRKDKAVSELTKGVAFLFKKNGVEHVQGRGRLVAANEVEVAGADGGTRRLEARNVILATGSDVAALNGIDIDEKRIVSSTGALALGEVPKRLLVVGAGAIGLELGSVWMRLGAEVTVIEILDRILPEMDGEIAKTAERLFKRQGMSFRLASKVMGAKAAKSGLKVAVEPAAGGTAETLDADVLLIAIGRRPYTDGLGLEEAGVLLDNRGRIKTDGRFRTGVGGVFAIGDVIAGPMLAHKAMDEGVACAEIIAGEAAQVNYGAIPSVVYTMPEIASVGRGEEELKAEGRDYAVGKFPFLANSRAKTNFETDGLVKILADKKTDRVLGVHMIGTDAGNMIAEAVVALEFGASAEDIAMISHAHPTHTEAVKEAALAVSGRALHA